MPIPILGDIIHEVGGIIEKVVPDADKRMDLQLQLAQLADQEAVREQELLKGQIQIDNTEAGSGNLFVAGWRPFIGWTCGVALAYTWIVAPLVKPIFHLTQLPIIDPSQIYPIVLAMLGVAGLRTYEKVQGVATGQIVSTPASPQTPAASVQSSPSSSLPSKIGKWFK